MLVPLPCLVYNLPTFQLDALVILRAKVIYVYIYCVPSQLPTSFEDSHVVFMTLCSTCRGVLT